ncbi:hypothetical protein [Bacillus sp. V5-8f]|uniref:hypothetical protein n=1 Tax=Bacillus sp. V5-8f TaxID=2053044 RepID=UPI000C791892|nr:hypothetical protein [Bacillus sp. V5-8f]PLT33651.1 hypothetical protein CUU64_11005 [Bacillus sp. V5-8f]
MDKDIKKASLREVISLIKAGKTDQEIGAMFNLSSGSAIYSRLKIVGADKSTKKWDFTNIDQSMLDDIFWDIRQEKKLVIEKNFDNPSFSEEQINALKVIADEYINRSSKNEDDETKYKMFGRLLFEHANYKNKDIAAKQLNVPIPDPVMQRLDDFTNRSGLEKRFIVNKALEVFLDLYQNDLK